MKSVKVIFRLLVYLALYFSISGCQTEVKIEEPQTVALDPAYDNLLTSISLFEQENNFATDPPTRKKRWGFIVAADAVPLVIGGSFGGTGWIVGGILGILNSFYVALFENNDMVMMDPLGQIGPDWSERVVSLREQNIDNTQLMGAVHNAVLQQLIQESSDINYSQMSDWELFSIIQQKVSNFLPEESASISQSQFQQLMTTFPDSRNYTDLDSFEGACLSFYPEKENDFIIASRVLSTMIAQDTEDQLDSYEMGVIQLIRNSDISQESKTGLIGTVSVQKASREFWYE